MENNTQKTLEKNKTIIIIFLIAISLVYFFGIRPSQIRKQCSFYRLNSNDEFSSFKSTNISTGEYESCLRKKGLSN